MSRDAMLDIETYDLNEDAVIISVGLVVFNPRIVQTSPEFRESFYVNIDPRDAKRTGGTVNKSTVMWWKRQSNTVKRRLLKDRRTLKEAMQMLADFLVDHNVTRWWGKGPGFDCNKVRRSMERVGVKCPIHYRKDFCVRTAIDMAFDGIEPDVPAPKGAAHDALYDAAWQALVVQRCYYQLGLTDESSQAS